jgi:hypothetical protein
MRAVQAGARRPVEIELLCAAAAFRRAKLIEQIDDKDWNSTLLQAPA